jgi:hypothetical protein
MRFSVADSRGCLNTLLATGAAPSIKNVAAKPGCGASSAHLLCVTEVWLWVSGNPCSA